MDVGLREMRSLEDEIESLANLLDEDDENQAEFERDMRRRANTLLSYAACIGHGDETKVSDSPSGERIVTPLIEYMRRFADEDGVYRFESSREPDE